MEPISREEKRFCDEIRDKLHTTRHYRDSRLLQDSFCFIPYEELKIKATLKLSMINEEDFNISLEDCILLELLDWFKTSFFTWMNSPTCNYCNVATENKGSVPASESEIMWEASRVESYACPQCQRAFRFPRYNHPRKLLETRTGRCGEWANCFTLLCHALEYDARYVVDWTDHVWTEVFSRSRNKWIHCDPCENICNKPLVYELGWKKKLSYVIAFSPQEVQDVTWRYTTDFGNVLKRRKLCREEYLLKCISSLQIELQKNMTQDEKKILQYRRAMELADFLSPAESVNGSYEGRCSGDLVWRLARGESHGLSSHTPYVFHLSKAEIESRRFNVKYSCASDKYIRERGESWESEKWLSCVFSYSNVFRKVESDWKMAYLARTEGTPSGAVTWKFDFEGSGLVVNEIVFRLMIKTYESGVVKWILYPNCEKKDALEYLKKDLNPLVVQNCRRCSSLMLSAELCGGIGENAWQHTQLFRQSLNSDIFPFEVDITFLRES